MALLFAWLASILTGFQLLIVKASTKTVIRDPWLLNLLRLFFGSIPALAFGFISKEHSPVEWMPLLLASVCLAIFFALFNSALFSLDASVISPMFSLRIIFSLFIGVYLLDETIEIFELILIALVLFATPLSTYTQKFGWKSFLSPAIFKMVSALFFLAFMAYFTNRSSAANGTITTFTYQDFFAFIFLAPSYRLIKQPKETITVKACTAGAIIGFLSFIYTVFSVEAFERNVSLSTVIISLPISMILAAVLSKRYPHLLEENSKKVYAIRFTGAAIMVTSGIVLTLRSL